MIVRVWQTSRRALGVLVVGLALTSMCGDGIAAQAVTGQGLVSLLQRGGSVVVMRHASAPATLPDARSANPDNVTRERQLDAAGRTAAEAMGRALVALKIPVGEVLTSPAYRARETVRRLGLSNPQVMVEIGDNGQSMQGITLAQTTWLQRRVRSPRSGTNVLIVTHSPNIAGAFPDAGAVAEGEVLVCGADGRIVGRIRIDEWRRLATP